jgi:hypothetical protein
MLNLIDDLVLLGWQEGLSRYERISLCQGELDCRIHSFVVARETEGGPAPIEGAVMLKLCKC